MCVCMYVCRCVYVSMYVCMYVCMYVSCQYIYIYIYIYISQCFLCLTLFFILLIQSLSRIKSISISYASYSTFSAMYTRYHNCRRLT